MASRPRGFDAGEKEKDTSSIVLEGRERLEFNTFFPSLS